MSEEEYKSDVACGHSSLEGRPIVRVGDGGKFDASEAIDFEHVRPYIRKRHRAPWAHHPEADQSTVQSLFGPGVELPKFISGASLRRPAHLDVLRERNPQLSAINDGGWERITLIVASGASDTIIPPKVCRAAEIRSSSKVGTEYEAADGGVARNVRAK